MGFCPVTNPLRDDPQRESTNALLRERTPFIGEQTKVYPRDTYDHIARLVELIDSSREMASDLADAYLSNVSHRANEIVKVLTAMASIFVPMTVLAGIYGMIFENMPGLGSRVCYFAVLCAMAVLAIAMVFCFRRRGWIGLRPPPDLNSDRPPDEGQAATVVHCGSRPAGTRLATRARMGTRMAEAALRESRESRELRESLE